LNAAAKQEMLRQDGIVDCLLNRNTKKALEGRIFSEKRRTDALLQFVPHRKKSMDRANEHL